MKTFGLQNLFLGLNFSNIEVLNVFYFNYFIVKAYLYTFSIADIDVWRLFDWEKKTRFTVLMKKELWQNSIMKNEQNGKQRYFLNFEKWCIRRFKKSNSWYYLKILKLITNFPFFYSCHFFIFISYFVKFLLIYFCKKIIFKNYFLCKR